jgi:hypothetical protein
MSTEKQKTTNLVRSSTKRPRAPIACFRCHHKKVRCDGARPNCTRCLSTGVLCAYPNARKSRTTQPTNIDPFIDNLSQLEARIRQIELDLESQKSMVQSILSKDSLNTNLTKPEIQDSKTMIARGEQRTIKEKRAEKQQQSKFKSTQNTDMENYALSMSMYSQNMMMNDWSLLNVYPNNLYDISPNSSRSSSLASNITLQPSQSSNSVTSTAMSSCSDPIFTNFSMEDIIMQHPNDAMMYSNNNDTATAPVWYNF